MINPKEFSRHGIENVVAQGVPFRITDTSTLEKVSTLDATLKGIHEKHTDEDPPRNDGLFRLFQEMRDDEGWVNVKQLTNGCNHIELSTNGGFSKYRGTPVIIQL